MPPELEYKASPAFTVGIEGRTVTGIAVVHGNTDDGGDRSHPGLLGDGTVNGRKRAVFLWQHDASSPPTATIDRVFEVTRADLPASVLLYAPGATGGVAVQRTYLETPRGDEVLAGLSAGAITEMSYAFQLKRWDIEEIESRSIRNLYEADVYDFSDVNWGMNPATSADGRKGLPLEIEHQTVRAAVEAYTKRLEALAALRAKDGRVLSGENRKRIADAVEALDGAATTLRELLAATEPKQTASRGETRQLYLQYQQIRQRVNQLPEARP